MLDIQTFDARRGGNVLYKALVHPLAAEAIAALAEELKAAGPLAVFDPEGTASALFALHPGLPAPSAVFVQDVEQLERSLCGVRVQPVTDLAHAACSALLVAGVRHRTAGGPVGRSCARPACLSFRWTARAFPTEC